jgi:hypothetical protein
MGVPLAWGIRRLPDKTNKTRDKNPRGQVPQGVLPAAKEEADQNHSSREWFEIIKDKPARVQI